MLGSGLLLNRDQGGQCLPKQASGLLDVPDLGEGGAGVGRASGGLGSSWGFCVAHQGWPTHLSPRNAVAIGPWTLSLRDREAGSDFSLALALPWQLIYSAQGGIYLSVLGCHLLLSQPGGRWGQGGEAGLHEFTTTRLMKPVPVRTREGGAIRYRTVSVPPSLHPPQMPSAQIRGAGVPLS